MHMDPLVPNQGRPGRGPVLAEGMALAIEPLLVLGRPATLLAGDGWTVVTEDGGWAAHFEHTVAITADGPWVLTAPKGLEWPKRDEPGRALLDAGPGDMVQGAGSGQAVQDAGPGAAVLDAGRGRSVLGAAPGQPVGSSER
jgi:hypothetical protein